VITSQLGEKGLNPVEVATITGHKDPRMLMRYTHLRAEDLARKVYCKHSTNTVNFLALSKM
jgi:hypothetical protein